MNNSVSKSPVNIFLYEVHAVRPMPATATGRWCSPFEWAALSQWCIARRRQIRRIIASRRRMTGFRGRARSNARYGTNDSLHPMSSHHDLRRHSAADHRKMMASYCNAALRRRQRERPLPPPPIYRKPCPSSNLGRRMNSADCWGQTTRVCRITNEPALTNPNQSDLRGDTRGRQHRRETTLHLGVQPLGVAVRRRNIYDSRGSSPSAVGRDSAAGSYFPVIATTGARSRNGTSISGYTFICGLTPAGTHHRR